MKRIIPLANKASLSVSRQDGNRVGGGVLRRSTGDIDDKSRQCEACKRDQSPLHSGYGLSSSLSPSGLKVMVLTLASGAPGHSSPVMNS